MNEKSEIPRNWIKKRKTQKWNLVKVRVRESKVKRERKRKKKQKELNEIKGIKSVYDNRMKIKLIKRKILIIMNEKWKTNKER